MSESIQKTLTEERYAQWKKGILPAKRLSPAEKVLFPKRLAREK